MFAASQDNAEYQKKGSELPVQAKNKLQELVSAGINASHILTALDLVRMQAIDKFWQGIRDLLKGTKFAYLVNTPLVIGGKKFNLTVVFNHEYNSLENKVVGILLMLLGKGFFISDVENALVWVNNQKLNDLWSTVKDELQKPEYVHLVKVPINDSIDWFNFKPKILKSLWKLILKKESLLNKQQKKV